MVKRVNQIVSARYYYIKQEIQQSIVTVLFIIKPLDKIRWVRLV